MIEQARGMDSFWVESAILEITEEIVARMKQLGVSKSDLAKLLGKSPAFITKLLQGNNNFTLETIVKIARRLNCQLRSHLQPAGLDSQWIDYHIDMSFRAITRPNEDEPVNRPVFDQRCYTSPEICLPVEELESIAV